MNPFQKNRNQKWKTFPNKHISILKDLGHAAVLKHAIFWDVKHRSDRPCRAAVERQEPEFAGAFREALTDRYLIFVNSSSRAAMAVGSEGFFGSQRLSRNVERGRFPSRHGATPSRHQSCFSCEVMVFDDYQACFSTKSWSSMTTGWFGNSPISGNRHILIIHDYHRWIDDDDDGDGGGGAAAFGWYCWDTVDACWPSNTHV